MSLVNETILMDAHPAAFPLICAAADARNRCKSCGHGSVNVHAMLRMAVNKYKNDKEFKTLCESLFRLPCMIAGIAVEKE